MAVALALAATASPTVVAEARAEWRFAVVPLTLHRRPNPEHKQVWAIGSNASAPTVCWGWRQILHPPEVVVQTHNAAGERVYRIG